MSKVFIEETTLTAIGDAIREKTGKTELIAPLSMATEISSITTGGGGGEDIEPIVLTGDCSYACAGNIASEFIRLYGDKVSTTDITGAANMFYNSKVERIPFTLNFKIDREANLSSLFDGCLELKEIPPINNAYPNGIQYLFDDCQKVRYLPEDLGISWNWNRIHTYAYVNASTIFNACKSLRKIPDFFLSNLWGIQTSSSYFPYRYMCSYCCALDEINNIPVHPSSINSNVMNSIVSNCYRLKDITFSVNEDGTAKTANWKSQIIELSDCYIGYCPSTYKVNIIGFNSGITKDKEVNDETTYQALKNDADWFATKLEYSRYNRISAVNTINSLPDTSAYLATAGGTNTIKFKGASGSATDGGAINTMTEEEIAVATAKGWTVSFT